MRSYLKTLALVLLAMSPVILLQAAHPIRNVAPITPLPAPIFMPNFYSTHGPAEIRLTGDLLTIELAGYYASGRADDAGVYRVTWLTIPSGEVRYVGLYRFDDCGDLAGVYMMLTAEHGVSGGCGDRYLRIQPPGKGS